MPAKAEETNTKSSMEAPGQGFAFPMRSVALSLLVKDPFSQPK